MTWDKHIKGYCDHLRLARGLSPITVKVNKRVVTRFAGFLVAKDIKALPVQITPKHIREYIVYMNKELQVSAPSQAQYLSTLRSFFDFIFLDVLGSNPVQDISVPMPVKKLPQVLHIDQIESLLRSVDLTTTFGYRNRAILEIMYACGLRRAEVCNLKITNLHFEEEYIRIIGKGDKERIVPINSKAMHQVSRYMEKFRATPAKGHEDYVFLSERNTKLSGSMVFEIIRSAARAAGIKDMGPHTLRHSFATHLVDGGADLSAVQDMLGHASITTTEVYSNMDKKNLHDTIKRFHPAAKGRKKGYSRKPDRNA